MHLVGDVDRIDDAAVLAEAHHAVAVRRVVDEHVDGTEVGARGVDVFVVGQREAYCQRQDVPFPVGEQVAQDVHHIEGLIVVLLCYFLLCFHEL